VRVALAREISGSPPPSLLSPTPTPPPCTELEEGGREGGWEGRRGLAKTKPGKLSENDNAGVGLPATLTDGDGLSKADKQSPEA